MTEQDRLNCIYEETPLAEIPWHSETPPTFIRERVLAGHIAPCRAAELGCGGGTISLYLAALGFDVTGVDFAPAAIAAARHAADRRNLPGRFAVADVLGDLSALGTGFGLVCDYNLLHHIPPEQRPAYLANVHSLLAPGGIYLSASFHRDMVGLSGTGAIRHTALGTTLYLSTENELRELFSPSFLIDELRQGAVPGHTGPYLAILAQLRRGY